MTICKALVLINLFFPSAFQLTKPWQCYTTNRSRGYIRVTQNLNQHLPWPSTRQAYSRLSIQGKPIPLSNDNNTSQTAHRLGYPLLRLLALQRPIRRSSPVSKLATL
jgi:hypothetical protein